MEVLLYDEGCDQALDIAEIADYLRRKLGRAKVEIRGSPFSGLVPEDISGYAGAMAGAKIQEVNRRVPPGQPFPAEIEYEKRRMLGKTRAFGVLYDGAHLLKAFTEVLPQDERRLELVHVVFTNRLFATWDENDRRYHLRTSLYAIPSIISTTGLVEAPARPKEYYLIKQQYEGLGKDLAELKLRFKGNFLDYGDERLTEVTKGYVMQAVFYSLIGDPFCQDKGCRLYNAHWQEEMIFAQLESNYEFCQRHAGILKNLSIKSGI